MKYCFRCGKEFTTDSNLYKHLKIMRICPNTYLDISREIIKNKYDEYLGEFLEKKKSVIEKKTIEKEQEYHITVKSTDYKLVFDEDNSEMYVCCHCGYEFKHKMNCVRHVKDRCPILKKKNKNSELLDELLESKIELLEFNYSEKLNKEKEERIKEREELEEKIKNLQNLLNQQQIIPHQNSNSQINIDGGNVGQIAENITNNIVINNYGQEDLSSIDRQVFESIASNEYTMIQELINYIHIKTECNRNIYIPSHKEKYAMIQRDDEWDIVDKKELIDDLVRDKRQILFRLLDMYKDELETISAKRTKSVLEYCETDAGEIIKIKSDVLTKLLNNKDDIRYTFEINRQKKLSYGRKKKII